MKTKDAENYAISNHRICGCSYDGRPYEYHLESVIQWVNRFIHLIPMEDREDVVCAAWCHDVIEDCRETYNDVKELFGERVAEIVYAVTNEKGKNRHERANDKYYEGIRNTQYATFVKLCDRLANVEYSKFVKSEGSMYKKYKSENENFTNQLANDFYKPLFETLDKIFNH
jgi:(p)ppGpp synthase/HD superfamily hydrolase